MLLSNLQLSHCDRYLKKGVSKSIVLMKKHCNSQFCRAYPDGVICKNWQLKKRHKKKVGPIIHQIMCVSKITCQEEKIIRT